MFKLSAFVVFCSLALAGLPSAAAKPSLFAPLAYSAPAAAVYTREYHGNYAASPYVAAAAPYVAAAPYAAASPYVASPYVASPYAASPYFSSPYVASPYVASPYGAAYSAPLLLKK